MNLVLATLWPALVAALPLGLVAGWVSGLPDDRGSRTGAAILVLAVVILGVLALARPIAGIPGLWVETASLLLATYLGGCVAGALARRLRA